MTAHVIYLVGGTPRVGKSSLAQRLLAVDGIPWLPTDVIRTVARRVAPEVDAIDQDPVDAAALAEIMYPYIEQAVEVCAEEAVHFLGRGIRAGGVLPHAAAGGAWPDRDPRVLPRAWLLLSGGSRRLPGPKPQAESDLSSGELHEAASWIRTAAGSSVSSATHCACRTSTLGRRASRARWPKLGACFSAADTPTALDSGASSSRTSGAAGR